MLLATWGPPVVCVYVYVCVLNPVQLFDTPWTVAHLASLSMGFPRQQYWSRLPFPPPGVLPNPGIEPVSPALVGRFFTTEIPENHWFSIACGHNAAYFAWKAQGRNTLVSLLRCMLTQEPLVKLWERGPELQLPLRWLFSPRTLKDKEEATPVSTETSCGKSLTRYFIHISWHAFTL